MAEVLVISMLILVPLVGSLLGDRYFTNLLSPGPEAAPESEET